MAGDPETRVSAKMHLKTKLLRSPPTKYVMCPNCQAPRNIKMCRVCPTCKERL